MVAKVKSTRGVRFCRLRKIVNDRCRVLTPDELKHLQKHRRARVGGKPRGLCGILYVTLLSYVLRPPSPLAFLVVVGIGPSRGSWFYHCFSKVVFDERFYLSCELSQSIAPATQNEVPCPVILHAFMFNPFLAKSWICFLSFLFVWYKWCCWWSGWGDGWWRSLLIVTKDDVGETWWCFLVFLVVLEWGVGGWRRSLLIDWTCHERWCWWDMMMLCWLSWGRGVMTFLSMASENDVLGWMMSDVLFFKGVGRGNEVIVVDGKRRWCSWEDDVLVSSG